ncbi:MAG: dihydroorotate dehydrogenase electron transfer subunit [Heliobacteriaceae bacterium]|nr:dihydroorotate dehydrogenase electron transfer subunit [Heliobacteriaceae bacterium]MDD4587457.1 dihydroorotate dehydrogenase electron transfer subunit [Heliobacteriaceae bacterium]
MKTPLLLTAAPVIEHEQLKPDVYRLVLAAPSIARQALPGQFIQVRVNNLAEPLLPRPFSLARISADQGTITLLYRIVGRGTRLLAGVPTGQTVQLWGPLGQGWALPAAGGILSRQRAGWPYPPDRAVMPVYVAGGMGIAPLLPLAVEWYRQGQPGLLLYGVRSGDQLALLGQWEELGVKVRIATEDGSVGIRGTVIDLLAATCLTGRHPVIYACGPWPLLKAIHQIARGNYWPCQVSLEERMACGVGACLGCVCRGKIPQVDPIAEPVPWRHVRVCREGPVFWSDEVVWDG